MVSAPAPARAANVVSTWNTTTAGNWSDLTKWANAPAAATFPNNGNLGHTYDALISKGSVTLDRDTAVRDLTASGGILLSTGTSAAEWLTVNRTFTLGGGGDTRANVRVPVGGSFVLANATSSAAVRTVNVAGTMSFGSTSGAYTLRANGVTTAVEIESTGTFAFTRPLTLQSFGRLINRGTIDQSPGADFSSPWSLYNYGTFRSNAPIDLDRYGSDGGFLDLQFGSVTATATATIGSMTFTSGGLRLAPGATLKIASGVSPDHTFGAISVTNAGTIILIGSARFTSPITIPGVVRLPNSNELTFDADVTFTGPTTMNSIIAGTGRVRGMNLTYAEGYLRGAELNVPAGGTVTLSGSRDLSLYNGARITVDGLLEWQGRTIAPQGTVSSRLEIRPGGTVHVRPSATVTLDGWGSLLRGSLVNDGLLDLDRAQFTANRGWDIINSGTIRATGGTIQANLGMLDLTGHLDLRQAANANFSTSTPGQSFVIAPGARLSLATSARASLNMPATNAGSIEIDGPTAQFGANAMLNSGTVRAAGGKLTISNLTNSGTVDLGASAASFFGGLHQTAPGALLRVTGSASATASVFVNASSLRVESGGQFTAGGATSNSGNIRVGPGSTGNFHSLTNSGSVHIEGPGTVASFTNVTNLPGSVMRVASSAVANVANSSVFFFSNRGNIEVEGGARLRATARFINAGTVRVTAAALTVNALYGFTNSGTIDLSAGGAMVAIPSSTLSTLAQMRAQIISAYAGGAWTGTGVTSLGARADSSTAVGYAAANHVDAATLAWLGNHSNSGHVILRHTKYGDADLDGAVDFADLVRLAQNYNATNRVWSDGDFTYDGAIDFNDLVKLAQNYNTALQPTGAIPGASASFNQDLARAFASVPEPGGLALLIPAACGLAARRRRQCHTPPRA
jgi:hypothetical protein